MLGFRAYGMLMFEHTKISINKVRKLTSLSMHLLFEDLELSRGEAYGGDGSWAKPYCLRICVWFISVLVEPQIKHIATTLGLRSEPVQLNFGSLLVSNWSIFLTWNTVSMFCTCSKWSVRKAQVWWKLCRSPWPCCSGFSAAVTRWRPEKPIVEPAFCMFLLLADWTNWKLNHIGKQNNM